MTDLRKLLRQYDASELNEYEFIEGIASAKKEAGNGDIARAIMVRVVGKAKNFANQLVIRLMTTDHNHINGSVVNAVESYLFEEYDANEFVEVVICNLGGSFDVSDQAFASKIAREYYGKFTHMADGLYVAEANRLAKKTVA